MTLGAPGFHPDGFLIYLDEQADLGPAAAIADPVERRAWAYQALVETAERSQAPLRAELDRRGVSYRPHYLVNMIEVLERPGLRRAMARQPGVASVLFQPGVRPYPRGLPLPNLDPACPRPAWNGTSARSAPIRPGRRAIPARGSSSAMPTPGWSGITRR